jgi:hydrogenase nickel insertion protein HypA
VKAVIDAASRYEDVQKVEEIHISIGRLTFVGKEQLKFCWEAVTAENELLRGSSLFFSEEPVMVRCGACGYEGDLEVKEDPLYHYMMPVFACPKCGKDVDIIKGKGITVSNVKLLIDDGIDEDGPQT